MNVGVNEKNRKGHARHDQPARCDENVKKATSQAEEDLTQSRQEEQTRTEDGARLNAPRPWFRVAGSVDDRILDRSSAGRGLG
jgi:hypothetical protein